MTGSEANILQSLLYGSLEFVYVRSGRTLLSRLPPRGVQWHVHPFLLATCIEGGILKIELESGRQQTIEPGRGFIVPAGMRYRGLAIEPDKTVSNWLNANYFLFHGIDVFSFFDVPVVLDERFGAQLGALNVQLTELSKSSRPGDPLNILRAARLKELGFRVLNILLSQSTVKDDAIRRLTESQQLEPVIAHIHDSLHDQIRTGTLAGLMGLSESRFYVVFKNRMGVSPQAYVRARRVRRAQFLLATTGLTVTEVARGVGYEDVFQFSRMFKKQQGLNPRAYRASAAMIG